MLSYTYLHSQHKPQLIWSSHHSQYLSLVWISPRSELADGWFRTGDLGYLDKAGNLHLVGRLKDVIRSGSENVAAPEVERVQTSPICIEVHYMHHDIYVSICGILGALRLSQLQRHCRRINIVTAWACIVSFKDDPHSLNIVSGDWCLDWLIYLQIILYKGKFAKSNTKEREEDEAKIWHSIKAFPIALRWSTFLSKVIKWPFLIIVASYSANHTIGSRACNENDCSHFLL